MPESGGGWQPARRTPTGSPRLALASHRPPHHAAVATAEVGGILAKNSARQAALARERTAARGLAPFSHLRHVFLGSACVLHSPAAAIHAHGNLSVAVDGAWK